MLRLSDRVPPNLGSTISIYPSMKTSSANDVEKSIECHYLTRMVHSLLNAAVVKIRFIG